MCHCSELKCKNCPFWQGRYLDWGQCNYVMGEIFPQVRNLRNIYDYKIRFPFDPHDVKYFENFPRFYSTPPGVRIWNRKEKDVRFIFDGYGIITGERIANVSLQYFMTHKDYCCGKEIPWNI